MYIFLVVSRVLNASRHKALEDPVEQSALKAFISHDGLVHPDHPLRTSIHGIELFMGT